MPQEPANSLSWPASIVNKLCQDVVSVPEVAKWPEADAFFTGWCREQDIAALLSVPVRTPGGAVSVLCITDTSSRTWTDTEVRTLQEVAILGNALFAQKVAERARRTTDKRQSEASVSRTDGRTIDFLAKLVHDLRDPLTPLQGALQLADQVAGEGEQARLRSLMARQLRQLVERVDELAQLVRILRRSLPLDKQRIELTDTVRAALEATQSQREGAVPTLDLRYPDEPLHIEADHPWILRAFTAIFEITLRVATTSDHVSIRLARKQRLAVVRIVIDKGVALQVEDHRQDFGAGLDFAGAIVDMHGGRMRTYPTGWSGGSAITVALPLGPADTARS